MAGFAFQRLQSALLIQGNPVFHEASATAIAETAVDVLSFTTVAETQLVSSLAHCAIAGKYEVLSGASVIASGHTSPGDLNFSFNWFPARPIGIGAIIKVRFTARNGAPGGQQVNAYLMTTEN